MRIRFTTNLILWLTLLLAVCMGWAIDGVWHRRQLRRLNEYEKFRQKVVADLEGQFRYALEVNNEMRGELQWFSDELRARGFLRYSDAFPTRNRSKATRD